MIMPFKPTSNYQRQQEFLARHPGYYQRYHAKRRAELKAALAAQQAQLQATAREPLMLPAPVETIEIPGMTTIEGFASCEAIARPVRGG
jgi:hypothetical protein